MNVRNVENFGMKSIPCLNEILQLPSRVHTVKRRSVL